MKAIVKAKRAPGAELKEVRIPKPKSDEVLVKVKAASICGTDVHIYKWNVWAQKRVQNLPLVMGHELAGEIVKAGSGVKNFKKGDYVSAETHIYCNECFQCRNDQKHLCANLKLLGVDSNGSFAEYVVLPEKVLWRNNPSLPLEIASLQEPLGNAVYCVSVTDVANKTVLIFGDGPAGLLAVGVTRALEAAKIILVGRNNNRLKIGRKMGADEIVNDLEEKDTAEAVLRHTDGQKPDIVLEMAGSKKSIELSFKLVRKGGRLSVFGIPSEPILFQDYARDFIFSGATIYGINGRLIWQTWEKVDELLNSGKLDITPIITHKLPLKEFEKGFSLMMEPLTPAGKIILIP